MPEAGTRCLLLGGTVDGKWVPAEAIAPKLKPGQRCVFYSESARTGVVQTGKTERESPWLFVGVPGIPGGSWVGIGGDWNAIPRKAVCLGSASKTYARAAQRICASKGLAKSRVKLEQVMRVDLEGDGQDEIIFAAASPDYDPVRQRKGQCSFVALRRIAKGKVQTLILCGRFHRKDDPGAYPESYRISGFCDVDGDGVLEIGTSFYCPRADAGGISIHKLTRSSLKLLVRNGVGH